MRVFFSLFCLCIAVVMSAGLVVGSPAVTFERGLTPDMWVTWPRDEAWSKPGFLDVFPEWRRSYGLAHLPVETRDAIAETQAAGPNVLIVMRSLPRAGWSVGAETYLSNETSFAAYLALVRAMGAAIKDGDPSREAFEPINEPIIDCPYEQRGKARLPATAKVIQAAAREAAPGSR